MITKSLIFFIIFSAAFCDPDDDQFLQNLQNSLYPPILVDVRDRWNKLGITQYNTSPYKTLYKNSTHIAIEFFLPPSVDPKSVPKFSKVPTKPLISQKDLYAKFYKMIQKISPLFYVDPQIYQIYSAILGNFQTTEIVFKQPNLSAYLLQPVSSKEFPKMRFFIPKNFQVKRPLNVFPGNRFGLRSFDDKILGLYFKCFPEKEDPKKKKLVAECTEKLVADPLQKFEYSLIYRPQNDLFILDVSVNENDTNEVIEAKYSFIHSQSELLLSKKLLRKFGLIGFYNKDDNAYTEVEFIEPGKETFVKFQYLSIIRKMNYFNEVEQIEQVQKQCIRITDKLITWDLLGTANSALDINMPTFQLVAFETKTEINYVYDFIEFTNFKNTNLWDNVKSVLPKFDYCSYHNDKYFMKKELDEVYLITFTVKKSVIETKEMI